MEPKRTNYSLTTPTRGSSAVGIDDYANTRSGSLGSNDAVAARQQVQQLKAAAAAEEQAKLAAEAAKKQQQLQAQQAQAQTQMQPATQVVTSNPPAASQIPVKTTASTAVNPARVASAKSSNLPKLNVIDGFAPKPPKQIQQAPAPVQTQPQVNPNPAPAFVFKRYLNSLLNSGLYNPGSKALSLSLLAIKLSVIANLTPKTDSFRNQPGSALRAATIELFNLGKFSVEHLNNSENTAAGDDIKESSLSLSSLALNGKKDAGVKAKGNHKLKFGEIVSGISLRAHQKRNHIKAVVAASIACGIIVVSGGFMYANSRNLPEGNISGSVSLYVNSATVQNQSEQTPVSQDQNSLKPNHFKISSLNIDAPAITVGLTNDNAVDVPQQLTDVAWFNGSALPGKPGVTFLVGHYAAGYGGVFDNLTKIKDGDIIEMTDANNNVFKYKVTEKTKQKVADINMDNLLNSSPGENKLVIMTCAGSYIAQNYTDRFIVTATPVN
jgi:LPXTG-site transpeptidase (sortase) family protein